MSKISNPIWTESNGLVSVIGSYKQNVDGQIHAIIRNRNDSGKAPYRTLCETYVSLHFINSEGAFTQNGHKLYIHSLPFRNITCKKCLRIINNSKRVARPARPLKPKKFFLVSYDDGFDTETFNNVDSLLKEINERRDEVVKIRLIESYKTILVKSILIDEDGKEITEEDL